MAPAAAPFFSEFFSRPRDLIQSRARIARVARLLDSAFVIPGTNIRIGLDPLLGLIPGAGDAATALLSIYIVYEARRAGLPKTALLRMAANIAIDAIIGTVPLLGDVGDIFWRANRRNLAIFDDHVSRMSDDSVIEGDWRRIDQ
jgi:hypothetical protein